MKAATAFKRFTRMLHRHERYNLPGSVHFITTVTRVRGRWFVQPDVCEAILRVFEKYRAATKLHCLEFVLMPDHLHAVLLQTEEAKPVFRLMNSFKGYSSRFVTVPGYPVKSLWRADYDDVKVPGPDERVTKACYIRNNPVKAGLVEVPEAYPWSSAWFRAAGRPSPIHLSDLSNSGALLDDIDVPSRP